MAGRAGLSKVILSNVAGAAEPCPAGSDAASVEAMQSAQAWRKACVSIERRMFTDLKREMPDGQSVAFWGFEDPVGSPGVKEIPAPLIRVSEGSLAEVVLDMPEWWQRARMPERPGAVRPAGGRCIYQWQTKAPGAWLFQHHASTALDFEMGLFGALIIDPPPLPDGRRVLHEGGMAYDVERCLVIDDVDPKWHDQAMNEGASAAASSLRRFEPRYFLLNGVPNTEAEQHPDCRIEAAAGQKVLLRLLNASFSLVRVRIERLKSHIVAIDGEPLGTPERPWTSWQSLAPDQSFLLATSTRNDILIDLDEPENRAASGSAFRIKVDFLDWKQRTVRNAGAKCPGHRGSAATVIAVV